LQALDDSATSVAKYFDRKVSKVQANLGWEQEYFLVDSSLAASRPDLILSGRTLIGHAPAKGQQLDDHYFGSIPSRAMNFMRDMEKEAMSSKSAAANPIFKDLLEDERTQIDKAIHIALFKAGQKSSEAPAKIFFLGYLMEDLTSFCLNFAETEKRVYFQKEDRRGFLVISHLPFF
jgi:hypothetical protein